jgi:AraC-like DNA-binding protein
MFKASTGTSLQKYILERKIQRASRLLKDTDLSVKEISSQLGFKDQRNFTRTFRIYTDMTPRDIKNSSITPIYMKHN